jgi:hypothetical protein
MDNAGASLDAAPGDEKIPFPLLIYELIDFLGN